MTEAVAACVWKGRVGITSVMDLGLDYLSAGLIKPRKGFTGRGRGKTWGGQLTIIR